MTTRPPRARPTRRRRRAAPPTTRSRPRARGGAAGLREPARHAHVAARGRSAATRWDTPLRRRLTQAAPYALCTIVGLLIGGFLRGSPKPAPAPMRTPALVSRFSARDASRAHRRPPAAPRRPAPPPPHRRRGAAAPPPAPAAKAPPARRPSRRRRLHHQRDDGARRRLGLVGRARSGSRRCAPRASRAVKPR